MKRWLCIFICLMLVLSLAGCAGRSEPEPPWDGDDGQQNKPPEEPETGSGEVPSSVRIAYANWSDDPVITQKCINGEFFVYSDSPRLPLYRITSVPELNEFRNTFENTLTLHQRYDGIPSFDEQTAGFDQLFFQESDVFIAYVETSSGSFRFGLREIRAEDDTMRMYVVQTNDPETYDCAMAGWFVIAEVRKADSAKFEKFDAVRDWDRTAYASLPGMIEFGTFSYAEVRDRVDYGSHSIQTDGFVNTDEVDNFHPVERAKAEVTVDYDLIQYFYDPEEDVWMVRFFKSSQTGGEEVYLSGRGVTLLICRGDG